MKTFKIDPGLAQRQCMAVLMANPDSSLPGTVEMCIRSLAVGRGICHGDRVMEHYYYISELEKIWNASLARYRDGNREPESFLTEETLEFIQGLGMNVMDIYDFVEDFDQRGEPDFGTFLAIHELRRAYFLEVQKGVPSNHVLDRDKLPSKEAAVSGIPWLPRILPKARAKLAGELPRDLMYCCGGDRRFFKENNIHPAEFLRIVWQHDDDEAAIINWVAERRATAASPVS